MAHRVPVIATAVEGLPVTLAKARSVLVDPEDPDGLSSAITAVLAGRSGIDVAGAQLYAARFSPDLVAPHYARVYRRLLAPRAGAVADAA